MAIELKMMTVADLQKQLQALVEQGEGDLPVVGTDCRAYYPVQVYDVLTLSGYKKALQLYVRPDARFSADVPKSRALGPSTVAEWNAEADRVTGLCGAFA